MKTQQDKFSRVRPFIHSWPQRSLYLCTAIVIPSTTMGRRSRVCSLTCAAVGDSQLFSAPDITVTSDTTFLKIDYRSLWQQYEAVPVGGISLLCHIYFVASWFATPAIPQPTSSLPWKSYIFITAYYKKQTDKSLCQNSNVNFGRGKEFYNLWSSNKNCFVLTRHCVLFYCNTCTVHLHYLYKVPTNAQLINNLLHCLCMFRRYCVTPHSHIYVT
jgi:hypothetical protein